MIIERAIKNFTENYNQEMMSSIDKMSKEIGYKANKYKLPAFNINESTNLFKVFIEGYADYKNKNVDNKDAVTQEEIKKNVTNYIESMLFKDQDILYTDIPKYIESYIESINTMYNVINDTKRSMMENSVDQDAIGDVNLFVDEFVERMESKFNPIMDKILWASGYNASQRLAKNSYKDKDTDKPVFL